MRRPYSGLAQVRPVDQGEGSFLFRDGAGRHELLRAEVVGAALARGDVGGRVQTSLLAHLASPSILPDPAPFGTALSENRGHQVARPLPSPTSFFIDSAFEQTKMVLLSGGGAQCPRRVSCADQAPERGFGSAGRQGGCPLALRLSWLGLGRMPFLAESEMDRPSLFPRAAGFGSRRRSFLAQGPDRICLGHRSRSVGCIKAGSARMQSRRVSPNAALGAPLHAGAASGGSRGGHLPNGSWNLAAQDGASRSTA